MMKRQYSPSRATKARGLRGRTLYLIDLENMAGSSELCFADVAKAQVRIRGAVTPAVTDHTVIASSHHNAAASYFGWTGSAQRLARSGQDGADDALLEVVSDVTWIAARYDHVVIASGDHAFASAVAALKAAGCRVTVVAPDVGLSNRMRLAGGEDVVSMASAIPDNVISIFRTSKDVA
jgi:hypothetical protein